MTLVTKSTFPSLAENKASEAQSLRAFNSLNLLNIRTATAQLLGQIGKHGLFAEYTLHDISHIDKMLGMLEWLIPEKTREIMTPADWLMIVLGVYFHDLGMVVTRQEFLARESSGFKSFREGAYSGEQGEDYQLKVKSFSTTDDAERFLYQEFVRHNHARRIKLWIVGQASTELGVAQDASREVHALVKPLGERFCRDLALVCESHHNDDLYQLKKYKPNQAYGDDTREQANLQYSALLLRTADLLHVTQDRTPSLTFRLISPTDPISIEEWRKQMAVVAVRSKVSKDRDGQADQSLPRDTILVDAYFTNPSGFFALTKYLQYVRSELKQCHDWAKLGIRETGANYEFPWRYIDDSGVETHGFLNKQFEFTLDQGKILDLLTGHTLYNDIRVVLRELVQNSIDAIRLAKIESGKQGHIHIKWNSAARTLWVEDTGTGMSQRIIENHLLKVGSSRYQDAEFQKTHPEFNPISRFGIGVLSTFMIADEVEIVTSHPEDDQARQLSLRSVHGRYLVKLVDKAELPEPIRSAGHGTRIKLVVRPSVKMPDVVETARLWIVFPPCEVLVTVDSNLPVRIGFESPQKAVESYCRELGLDTKGAKFAFIEIDGMQVGYALQWDDFFREWSFVPAQTDEHKRDEKEPQPLGLCVEGIRVTLGTPGFGGHPIVAIANATGPSAPKTNVARSGLEATPQRDHALSSIYRALAAHVSEEVADLHKSRSFSLTWAAQEAAFLVQPLLWERSKTRPTDLDILNNELAGIPSIILEENGSRRSASPAEVSSLENILTVDSALFRSAELLLREIPTSTSLSALSGFLPETALGFTSDPVLCGFTAGSPLHEMALRGREVFEIRVDRTHRRVDLFWRVKEANPRWTPITRWMRASEESLSITFYKMRFVQRTRMLIGMRDIPLTGDLEGATAVRAFGTTYCLYSRPFAKCIRHYIDSNLTARSLAAVVEIATDIFDLSQSRTREQLEQMEARDVVDRLAENSPLARRPTQRELKGIDLEPLYAMFEEETWTVFDPSDWSREDKEDK